MHPTPPLITGQQGPLDALVVGASGGIGLALARALAVHPGVARLFPTSRQAPDSGPLADLATDHPGVVHPLTLDLTDDDSLAGLTQRLREAQARPQLVINCAGLLHGPGLQPEKSLAALRRDSLAQAFAVNAIGPVLLAQAVAPLLRHRLPAVFASLSARVGSIGDNRLGGWYAYRAAKAAQNQLLKTFSIELQRLNPQACCLLLHPGTVDTELSRPFQGSVARERLFSADTAAGHLLAVIAAATPADNGRFIAWDGRDIAW